MGVQPKISLVARPLSRVARNIMKTSKPRHPLAIVDSHFCAGIFLMLLDPMVHFSISLDKVGGENE
jgi:hypothetical protein